MIYSRSKNRFCTVKNIYEPTQTGMLVVNMLIDRFRFVLKGRLCYEETLYKTLVAVEYYSLTQSISSCTNIKINFLDADCVLKDLDSTNAFRYHLCDH